MPAANVLDINLAAIERNLRAVGTFIGPETGICPIVKADAYGLGLRRLGPRLQAAGADMFAVYDPDEAATLFDSGVGRPALVLMPVTSIGRSDPLYRALIRDRLHLTLHDQHHLRNLLRLAEHFGITIPVHLEVDTGMCRGGADPEDVPPLLEALHQTHRLRLAGIFTHFSEAERDDDRTRHQLARFDALLEDAAPRIPSDCLVHVANTAAMLRGRDFARSMVRVGLAWAGYGTELYTHAEHPVPADPGLQPALTWTSTIVHTRTIPADTPVGYGSRWTSRRPTTLGLVPVGYADGFPAACADLGRGNDARVGIRLADHAPIHHVPVVGAISMDQLTVDLTDIVERTGRHHADLRAATVELVSPDPDAPNHLPRLAAAAGIRIHQFLCGLGPRANRRYLAHQPADAAPPAPDVLRLPTPTDADPAPLRRATV